MVSNCEATGYDKECRKLFHVAVEAPTEHVATSMPPRILSAHPMVLTL